MYSIIYICIIYNGIKFGFEKHTQLDFGVIPVACHVFACDDNPIQPKCKRVDLFDRNSCDVTSESHSRNLVQPKKI